MDLLREVISVVVGILAAVLPLPAVIDMHVAALIELAIREKREALEALQAVPSWKVGPEQRELAEQAARELLDAITASQWAYDALCAAAGIDPDELMKSHRLSWAA